MIFISTAQALDENVNLKIGAQTFRSQKRCPSGRRGCSEVRSVGGRWGVLGGQNSPQTHSKPSQNELGDPNNNSVMSMQSFRSQERCPSGRGGRGEVRGRGARWGVLSGEESPLLDFAPASGNFA